MTIWQLQQRKCSQCIYVRSQIFADYAGRTGSADNQRRCAGKYGKNKQFGSAGCQALWCSCCKGYRRGLLLPNPEGVDTVSDQVAIAKRKAGIGEAESVELERFEVVRHE